VLSVSYQSTIINYRFLCVASRQASVLLLAACLPAFAAAWLTHPQWNEPLCEGDIALADALQRQPPPLWIDARPAGDFALRHAPGAFPLTPDRWDAQLPAVLQRWAPGQPAIVYCNSPACQTSHDIARRLEEFKLGPVYVLKGGWNGWIRN